MLALSLPWLNSSSFLVLFLSKLFLNYINKTNFLPLALVDIFHIFLFFMFISFVYTSVSARFLGFFSLCFICSFFKSIYVNSENGKTRSKIINNRVKNIFILICVVRSSHHSMSVFFASSSSLSSVFFSQRKRQTKTGEKSGQV
jgi:hypothetical protein